MARFAGRRPVKVVAAGAVLALVPLGPAVLAQLRGDDAVDAAAELPPPIEVPMAAPGGDEFADGLNRFVALVDPAAAPPVPAAAPAGSGQERAAVVPGDADGPAGVEGAAAASAPSADIRWLNDPENPLHLQRDALSEADRALLAQLAGGAAQTSPDAAPASSPSPTPAPAADAPAAEGDAVATLAALPGVQQVVPAGPGYVEVVTTLDRAAIAAVPGVADVEVETPRFELADYYPVQWPLRNRLVRGADIGWEDAIERASGDGITIAVIDSGFDLAHPDLTDQIWQPAGEVCGNGRDDDGNGFVDDCRGWDFVGRDGDVLDEAGHSHHGTMTSAVAVADRDRHGVTGVAPDARLMPLKVARGGVYSAGAMIQAIDYAVANGADVINMSFGGRTPLSAERAAVERAAAAGVVLTASAGNDGRDSTAAPLYPAAYDVPTMLAVASSTALDRHARHSNSSSTQVDLHAPGELVVTAYPGSRIAVSSGTSFAAPHVAGVAAMVLQRGASASTAVRTILDTAVRLPALAGRSVTGARLSAAEAVGTPEPVAAGVVAVAFTSTADALADRPDQLIVEATGTPGTATEAALVGTLATVHQGELLGVAGHYIGVHGEEVRTSDVATFPLGTYAADALAAGVQVPVRWTLPEGRYALMVEVIGPDGAAASPPQLTVFSVTPPTDPGAAPALPGGPGVEVPGVGVPGAGVPGAGVPGAEVPGETDPGVAAPSVGTPGVGSSGGSVPGAGGANGAGGAAGTSDEADGRALAPGVNGSTFDPDAEPGSTSGSSAPTGGSAPATGGGGGTAPDGSAGEASSSGGAGASSGRGPAAGGAAAGDATTTPPAEAAGASAGAAPGSGDGVDAPESSIRPVIGSVQPDRGVRDGGEQVEVYVGGGLPEDPYVHFGGRNARVVSAGATTALVITPAHAPGVVDVTILGRDGSRMVLREGFTYTEPDGSVPTETRPDRGASTDGDPSDGTPAAGAGPAAPGAEASTPGGGSSGDAPATGAPGSEVRGSTPSAGGAPTGGASPGTSSSDSSAPRPAPAITRGGLTLKPLGPSSPLRGLAVADAERRTCTSVRCLGQGV